MTDYTRHRWEISAEHSLFDLKLKDAWEYRDLLWLLVRRDFVSLYKQTLLGPVWYLIQPVITILIYTLVFGKIAGISTDSLPKPLFYLAGITIWNYFSDCFLKNANVFRDNAGVFSKVYFPRFIVPLSIIMSNMVRFGIQMLLFIALMLYYILHGVALHPNIYILLFPVLVILTAVFGLGAGMIISSLTTKYRDLSFLVSFGIQLLMYATTIIYPLSAAPGRYKWLIMANPMTAIIETFRFGCFGQGSFSWETLGYSAGIIILLFMAGIVVFTKVEKNFIDTV
jgi:lipopolysaccharide transport system permease protein